MTHSSENKRLISELISRNTGFHKGEENFGICQKYVTSNLRFHRYLDVDSHKVNKLLDGLYDKFTVHSKSKTGQILKQKVTEFLNTHEFEKKDVSETCTHYAILSFLLEMSNCPTAQEYSLPDEEAADDQLYDDFDWYTYLTEDLEPLQAQFSESSSDSEESDVEGDVVTVVAEPVVRDEDITRQVEATTNTLRNLLVTRYWAGETDHLLHVESDLAHHWKGHLKGIGSLESSHQDTYMTEYQMVREVLWMLSGATDTFLFLHDDVTGTYSLRKFVNLTHTTKNALAEILHKFTEFANDISQLRQFMSKFLKGMYPLLECQTYQAFCVACSELLVELDSFATELTSKIQSGDYSGTLISLLDSYKQHRQVIHIIHSVYLTAISPHLSSEQPSVSVAATQLLSTCNSAVNEASLQAVSHKVLIAVLKVFFRILAPYLSIIDEWLTKGNLNDPYSEFVIRKKNSDCLDETFWDTAVEVTALDVTDSSADAATNSFTFNLSVPELLEGALTKIAISGKSMEMLSKLGKLQVALGEYDRSLLCAFLDEFIAGLSWGSGESRVNHQTMTDSRTCSVESTISSLKAHNNVHPLLLANLKALFTSSTPLGPSDELGCLSEVNSCNMVNLSKVMSSSLGQLIDDRYNKVSGCLLRVLKDDCKLDHYLALIRKVYLLEAGNMMYEFLWELFDKIRLSEDWKDTLSLNVSLQECLEKQFPKDSFRFTVSLADVHRSELLPIHMLEALQLNYEVDWPISVLFNGECEENYNRIFQFLLQLKLAKYSVDHLKFDALTRKPLVDVESQTSNSVDEMLEQNMYVLRMRILHAINGIHDYIMTTILHYSSLQFEESLQMTTDLEMIMVAHRRYVTQIYNRCFLHESNSVLHDCLLRILNSSLLFQKMWDSSLTSISRAAFEEISSEFNRCMQILMSFITSFTKTGSLPHLESLVLALKTTTLGGMS